jgi:predicted GIY-YIG superfamily endonuclease
MNDSYFSYVSQRLPFELVYSEVFPTRLAAQQAEYRIKKWTRAKKEALIAQDWEKLRLLSKKKFSKS